MQILARAHSRLSPTLRHLLSSPQLDCSLSSFRAISSFTRAGHPQTPPPPRPLPPTSFSSLSHQQPYNYFSAHYFSNQAYDQILGPKQETTPCTTKPYLHGTLSKNDDDKENDGAICLDNQLRWGFIKKVYGIVGTQLLTTVAVSSVVTFCPPLAQFLLDTPNLFMGLCAASFASLVPLHIYQNKYPHNFISLGAFTLIQSLLIGSLCAAIDGKIVLQALGITSAAVSSLIGYTFWAARRGKDFSFLGPILFPSLVAIVATGLVNIFYPFSSTTSLIYSGLGALTFMGYIVLHTDHLIKRYGYDEYISASINLYLDILNLFLRILHIVGQLNKK